MLGMLTDMQLTCILHQLLGSGRRNKFCTSPDGFKPFSMYPDSLVAKLLLLCCFAGLMNCDETYYELMGGRRLVG